MVNSTHALGYLYALPATPGYKDIQTPLASKKSIAPTGGQALLVSSSEAPPRSQQMTAQPKVVFGEVCCTTNSYRIDVFVPSPASVVPHPIDNPAYIGSVTRLGMGPGPGGKEGLRNAQRCHKPDVTRVLEAAAVEKSLKEAKGIMQIVTDLGTGEVVKEEEWKQWRGFIGKVVWL